ncbi:MAG: polysulfide reductase NrfD, partial [Actinomycetota bacterium]|nr:polysulfide reductase NrfD [Actinomycetota bacterium]
MGPGAGGRRGHGPGRARRGDVERESCPVSDEDALVQDAPDRYGEGRFIDPSVGVLAGEASEQTVPANRDRAEGSVAHDVWGEVPSTDGGRRTEPTYYDRPTLKEPTWIWTVPTYFFAGGAAGAAAVLGAVSQMADRRDLAGLVKRCRWVGAAGGAAGTALLIADLGRPSRFLNMLRVFRPSSPMNLGSWVLSSASVLTAGSALLAETGGLLGVAGDAAGIGAGSLGLPLSGYTAVLLSNTAVPVWQATRRTLPLLFLASSVASAASLLELMGLSDRQERIVRRYGVAGKLAELAAAQAVEREADVVERVGRPLHEGLSGALWRTAKALTGASLALSVLPGRGRWKARLGGALGTAGAITLRFAVFRAGKASAQDPRATFDQQRAGRGGAEATGVAAVTGPGGRR